MGDSNKNNSAEEFCRNGDDSCNIDPAVATVVCNFLTESLSKCGYQWRSMLSSQEAGSRTIEAKVGIALRSLADEFSALFKEQFVEMCDKLEITGENLKSTIEGVANELFNEGIKWSRIVAFFVFGSELAVHCKDRKMTELINFIAFSLSSYISENLLPWINDHGGWEGLILYQEGDDKEQNGKNRWPSVKNLLCLGISALGALTLGAVLTKS